MSEVIRIFVEKKDGFNVLAKQTLWDIRHNLGMKSVEDLRYIVRYDLEGLTKEEYDKAKTIVLSEPNADVIYEETLPVEDGWKVFAMEYLPGQYDQRGDSAEQCVQLLTQGERCKVLTARVIALKGNITDEELVKVEEYLINPVESRLASLEKPKTLDMEIPVPENVETANGDEIIETDNVILAIGHSARDTFEMLYDLKLPIEAKPFSVGARIEHLRQKVDKAQYGRFAGNKKLGSASISLKALSTYSFT